MVVVEVKYMLVEQCIYQRRTTPHHMGKKPWIIPPR